MSQKAMFRKKFWVGDKNIL